MLEVAVGTGLAFAELLRRNPNGRNEGIDLTEVMLCEGACEGRALLGQQLARLIMPQTVVDFECL